MARQKSFLNVTFRINALDMPTVLETLKGTGEFVGVSLVETTEHKDSKEPFYVNGKRDKGIKGEDLLKELIGSAEPKKVFILSNLQSAFVARGFSKNSIYPLFTKAKVLGLIESEEPGVYVRTEKKWPEYLGK